MLSHFILQKITFMQYRLRTLLIVAMVASAALATCVCPLLDSQGFAWITGTGRAVGQLTRQLGAACMLVSVGCALFALLVALASEERVPAGFWGFSLAATALSVFLWIVTLPFVQSAT